MKKKRMLVCGASGFIGRNVFEYFSQKEDWEVWGTYKTRNAIDSSNMICADFTKKEDAVRIVGEGFDVLVHAAADTKGIKMANEISFSDNILMNTNLIEAAHRYAVGQMIFLSCSWVYPMNLNRSVSEEDIDLDHGIYQGYFSGAWVKIAAEKLCESFARLGRTKYTVIRHSNIYGPYDKYDLERAHVFGATMTKVMNTQDNGEVIVWGDGRERRDFLYVSDLVHFIELALQEYHYQCETYNVGGGMSCSVEALVKKIIRASGKNLSVAYDNAKPTVSISIWLDIVKAWQHIGWYPEIWLDEGIKKTLDWYRTNIFHTA